MSFPEVCFFSGEGVGVTKMYILRKIIDVIWQSNHNVI